MIGLNLEFRRWFVVVADDSNDDGAAGDLDRRGGAFLS